MQRTLARLHTARLVVFLLACAACAVTARPAHAQSTPTLTATSISNTQINLSWTSVNGATGYNLYESTTSGGEGNTPLYSGQTTAYNNTGLTAATPYYYQVAAVGGTRSTEQEAVTSPTGVTAAGGGASVLVTWSGGASGVTYNLLRSYRGSAYTLLNSSPVTGTSYTDTYVLSGVAYSYEIVALAGSVTSAPSTVATATPVRQVNAGGPGLTSNGMTSGGVIAWAADNATPALSSNLTLSTMATNFPGSNQNTLPYQLFQNQRISDGSTLSGGGTGFSFGEPNINDGNFTLNLYFAETNSGIEAGDRAFNVLVNGQPVLSNFDIYKQAQEDGATTPLDTVVMESVPVTIYNGYMTVAFQDVTAPNTTNPSAGDGALVAAFGLASSDSAYEADVPAPDWAQDVIPMDDAGAGGEGPSDGISTDLASGVEENHPGPDLSVYNPAGPRALYERMYRSSRALSGASGYGSPGLSPGWLDNYDYQVTKNAGSYTLTYPNGATETWTGTTGSLAVPAGLPYLASAPTASTLTMTFKDRSVYTFTLDTGSTSLYRLTGIANIVHHAITISRDSSHRLLSVVNDASPALTLLAFTYPTATTMNVADAYGRFVTLTFGTAGTGTVLTDVSQIASSGTPPDQWTYGYTLINSLPLLSSVKTPDPSSPPAAGQPTTAYATATITPNANGTVSRVQDGRPNAVSTVRTVTPMLGHARVTVTQNGGVPVTNLTAVSLYDTMNRGTGSIDGKNNASSAAYTDTNNPYQPTSTVNRNGQTTTFAYDQAKGGAPYVGNLTTMADNRGDVETLTYQYPTDFPLGQLQKSQMTHETNNTTDATREATSYTYYATGSAFNGLIDTVVSPLPGTVYPSTNTVTTTYVYDPTLINGTPLGNVKTVTYPAPNGTAGATEMVAYNYTTDGSFTQTASLGEPLTVTDANSNVTHFRYDARGNPITVIDAQGYETDTYYNVADQVQAVAYPPTTGTATNRAVEYYTYEYPGGPMTNAALYSEGQLTVPTPGMVFPAPSGVTPFRQTATAYDQEGDVLAVQDLVGTVATYTYDGDYRTVTSADGLGNTTGYVYDVRGDLIQEQYPAAYNSYAGAVQPAGTTDTMTYGYDDDQNPLVTVDGRGVVTALVRDDPESLTTQKSYGGLPVKNSGVTIDLTTSPSIGGDGASLSMGALPSSVASIASVSLAYDVWGRTASMGDGTGTLTFGDPAHAATPGYDDRDRVLLTTKSFTGGPQGQQLAYAYFQDGSLNTLTLPGSTQVSNPLTVNGGQFTCAYDAGGRWTNLSVPWRVSPEGIGSTNHFNFSYENNNWLNYVSGDLGYCQYNYDARGFLTSLDDSSYVPDNINYNGNFDSMVADYGGFTYDAAGNRLTEQMQSQGTDTAFAWDHALTWTYDNRDRLTHEHSVGLSSATVPSAATINYDQYFGYDGADNLTNFKDPAAGQMADFGFNADNQASSPMGFGFDGSGSLLDEPSGGLFGGDTLGYDSEERLVSVTAGSSTLLANAYDGSGMRAVKTTALGTTYFLDDASGSPVVEETYSASPMPTTTLSKIDAFGADGLRSRYTVTGGGAETVYLYDPQGTVVSRIVSSDPAVHNDGEVFTDLCVFDGYGQQRSDQWTGRTVDQQYSPDDPVGFEGQAGYYQDWELAKTSNPASYVYLITTPSLLTRRYYDASTGRFVNRDPIGYGGGQNLYAYCGGNPVNETDPDGDAPHQMKAILMRNGQVIAIKSFTSGKGSPFERAMFTRGGWTYQRYVCTEAKAVRALRFAPGDNVIFIGQKEPCGHCQNKMTITAQRTGASFRYMWRDKSGTLRVKSFKPTNPVPADSDVPSFADGVGESLGYLGAALTLFDLLCDEYDKEQTIKDINEHYTKAKKSGDMRGYYEWLKENHPAEYQEYEENELRFSA